MHLAIAIQKIKTQADVTSIIIDKWESPVPANSLEAALQHNTTLREIDISGITNPEEKEIIIGEIFEAVIKRNHTLLVVKMGDTKKLNSDILMRLDGILTLNILYDHFKKYILSAPNATIPEEQAAAFYSRYETLVAKCDVCHPKCFSYSAGPKFIFIGESFVQADLWLTNPFAGIDRRVSAREDAHSTSLFKRPRYTSHDHEVPSAKRTSMNLHTPSSSG